MEHRNNLLHASIHPFPLVLPRATEQASERTLAGCRPRCLYEQGAISISDDSGEQRVETLCQLERAAGVRSRKTEYRARKCRVGFVHSVGFRTCSLMEQRNQMQQPEPRPWDRSAAKQGGAKHDSCGAPSGRGFLPVRCCAFFPA